MANSKPKKGSSAGYEVGYARPPKANQFKPGQSGNPAGRPRGRPSFEEIILAEAQRIVKIKVGDKILHIDRDCALVRKLFDSALAGNMRALQMALTFLQFAQARSDVTDGPELPLTEEELAVLERITKKSGGSHA